MGHPIRMGGSEEDRHHRSFGYSEKGGALDANRIHHGANVVGTLLKRRRPGDSVGKALATLVERHDCREPRQATQESGIGRISCITSICEIMPGTINRLSGPWPIT